MALVVSILLCVKKKNNTEDDIKVIGKRLEDVKKMKILIVRPFPEKLNIDSYNVQEIGLAKALTKKGINADIVFFKSGLSDDIQTTEEGIKIYWLAGVNILKNGIFFRLSRIMEEYDIIQTHEYDQIQSRLLYTFSKKKIVIYHGPYFDSFNRGYNLKCKIFDYLLLPISKNAKKRVFCATKSSFASGCLTTKGFEKVRTIGVGLDPDKFDREDAVGRKLDMPQNSFNAIYIGKLEERRNITFLLKLAEKASDELKNFKLTIVGKYDEEYRKQIEGKVMNLIDAEVVTYIESADQKKLVELYGSSDVFLFTTNYDIFGMVLLEAMYHGVVPFSTVNGGAVTLIDDDENGFMFEDCNIELWIRKLKMLYDDPKKLELLKENTRIKIAQCFTWDALAPRFIEMYEEALTF